MPAMRWRWLWSRLASRAGKQNAVHGVEQRGDVGDLRRAGEDQGQGARRIGNRAQIALADALRRKLALYQVQAPDYADDGFSAGQLTTSALRFARYDGNIIGGQG